MKWASQFQAVLDGSAREEPPPADTMSPDHAVWRLWKALQQSPSASMDHAILIRQCLRTMGEFKIRGEKLSPAVKHALQRIDVQLTPAGYLFAESWLPDWLPNLLEHAPDSPPKRESMDEAVPAETWLNETIGKSSWRSVAQKEASWLTLQAEPGDTQLVGLPTGAGKSILFQLASAFSNGLTVVVVPTVALGLDQVEAARKLPCAKRLNPLLYSAGESADVVREAVEGRKSLLLFTSPEACVAGRLREVLDVHAENGWLQRVVIDEAHIVESWGADFRVEFQLLGGVVRQWRRLSAQRLRTLLLSATFSSTTVETLRTLFVDSGSAWTENIVQRLRPEMHYHFRRAPSCEVQQKWIAESLMKLPRPLILYVTEKEVAKRWLDICYGMGLRRVECFHGDIVDRRERARIMNAWRADEIDVMVATSAFGMGVDKADVRAVVHACFPESIDRYYQEVGRGGRDGGSSLSLLVYTDHDKEVGMDLTPTLLRPDTVNIRWHALWETRRAVSDQDGTYELNVEARSNALLGTSTYEEHKRWNKRLLVMLHRANLLTLTGIRTLPNEDALGSYSGWVSVSNIRFPTLDFDVGQRLAPDRDRELARFRHGLRSLEECIRGRAVCRELQDYYGGEVSRACGSCGACRGGMEVRRTASDLMWPSYGTPSNPRVQVVPMSTQARGRGLDEWVLGVRRAIDNNAATRFIVHNDDFEIARAVLDRACRGSTRLYRLDQLKGRGQLVAPMAMYRTVAMHPLVFRAELSEINLHGALSTHWMPRDQIQDDEGRARFTREFGARLVESLKTWIFENQLPKGEGANVH